MKAYIYKSSAIFFVFIFVAIGTRNCDTTLDIIHTPKEAKAAQLNELFATLKTSDDPYQTIMLEDKIMKLLMLSDEATTDTLMDKGVEALADENFSDAVMYFTHVIEKDPAHTEAWNKRATSFFMQGKMNSAIHDIKKTLVLESRHFGALSGLASIYLLQGKDAEALKIYERIARIAPAEPHIQQQIQYLRGKMGMLAI